MAVSRYLHYLQESGNHEKYMQKPAAAYNGTAAVNVMCRSTLSVSRDGYLYDCDLNQLPGLKVMGAAKHLLQFDAEALQGCSKDVGSYARSYQKL